MICTFMEKTHQKVRDERLLQTASQLLSARPGDFDYQVQSIPVLFASLSELLGGQYDAHTVEVASGLGP